MESPCSLPLLSPQPPPISLSPFAFVNSSTDVGRPHWTPSSRSKLILEYLYVGDGLERSCRSGPVGPTAIPTPIRKLLLPSLKSKSVHSYLCHTKSKSFMPLLRPARRRQLFFSQIYWQLAISYCLSWIRGNILWSWDWITGNVTYFQNCIMFALLQESHNWIREMMRDSAWWTKTHDSIPCQNLYALQPFFTLKKRKFLVEYNKTFCFINHAII